MAKHRLRIPAIQAPKVIALTLGTVAAVFAAALIGLAAAKTDSGKRTPVWRLEASTARAIAAAAWPKQKRKKWTSRPTHRSRGRVIAQGRCQASYYHEPQMTASGERFNPDALTAAHKTLPLGSRVRVINPRIDKSIVVRINDRGPYVGGRCLDLSRAAFDRIGNLHSGVMGVRYQVLARG